MIFFCHDGMDGMDGKGYADMRRGSDITVYKSTWSHAAPTP